MASAKITMNQTELIRRLNVVRDLMKDMDTAELEILRKQVSGELHLRRMGIK